MPHVPFWPQPKEVLSDKQVLTIEQWQSEASPLALLLWIKHSVAVGGMSFQLW